MDVAGSFIFPDFAAGTTEYTVVGPQDLLSFGFSTSPDTHCHVTYNGMSYTTCNISSIAFEVSQLPQPLVVSLFVPTDNPIVTVQYTFNLRKIGCLLSDLDISVDSGLNNCQQDAGSYPALASCITSMTSQISLTFAPYMSCPVQLVYYDGTSWLNCGEGVAGSKVTTNCTVTKGVNQYSVIAQDPYVPDFNSNIANVTLADGIFNDISLHQFTDKCLVEWDLTISNANAQPPFSVDVAAYELYTPCSQFTLAVADFAKGDCKTCKVLVNGNLSSYTFQSLSATDFSVQLCLNDCETGPAVTYQFAVSTGKTLNRTSIRSISCTYVFAEFPVLTSLTTQPGHSATTFAPQQLIYDVFTGYDVLNVAVVGSSNATVLMNTNDTTQYSLTGLSYQSSQSVTVQLQPHGFECFSPNAYVISAQRSTSQHWNDYESISSHCDSLRPNRHDDVVGRAGFCQDAVCIQHRVHGGENDADGYSKYWDCVHSPGTAQHLPQLHTLHHIRLSAVHPERRLHPGEHVA